MASLLHRDDGLAGTSISGETLADLELLVFNKYLASRGSILDIGCGRGRSCFYLALQGNDVVGVEIDLQTLLNAKQLKKEYSASCEFVRADGRHLCFREGSFDYAISLASTLSEKYRLWLDKTDRLSIISEAVRVTKRRGVVVVNFVHRYWNLRGFLGFTKNYARWLTEKLLGRRTEIGDYVEDIGGTPVRFHAFTIREASSLFRGTGLRPMVWRKSSGLFSDWFFVIVIKGG